jgi:glycosyltransferase involved in cell wall biosynthesis
LSPIQRTFNERILEDQDVKLIHAHFGPYGLDVLPSAKRLGIPLVVTFHGYDASTLLSDPAYTSQLKDLFDYAHVITASEDFLETLTSLGADRARLQAHHIGVPVDDFRFVNRVPPDEKARRGELIRFLQVSNFVEKKGHGYTIEAFERFLSAYQKAELVLAGDGPLRSSIESLCREKNLGGKIRFVGRVTTKEVIPLMSDADVFLHHSVTASDGDKEATTTVIAEAMSTGLIVVGTYHGGIPEMIEDGVDGYLVEERDVATYAEKLVGILECDSELGVRASEKIRAEFDLKKQNSRLCDIYEKIIGGA